MKSLSAKTFQCGVTVQGLTTLSGTVYLTALTNTATWDYVIVGTSAQGQLYTRTYAQLMSDVSSGITLSLDGLSDVVAPTPSTGQLLRYNGIQWANWTPTFYSLPAGGTTLQYIDGTGAFQTFPTSLPASSVKHQVKAAVAINKGQAVYVSSADGTNMIVSLASNTSEATSSKTMGLLDATVAINGFANVVTEGLLAGLDTTGAITAGDPVWLGTGGNLIYGLANKPYAPAHLVFIGIVTRINANNGEIFVKVQNGFELNEIHDVDLKTTVPVNGHILGFDGTLWVNKTIAGWLGYTPANASGTTNYISKFTGSTTLGNSQIFDNGTNVGIGTSSPAYKLDINGTAVVRSGTLNLVDYYLGISGTCADVNIFNNCGSQGNIGFTLGGNRFFNIWQVTGSSSGNTSGTHSTLSSSPTYAWSSGTAISNHLLLAPTINNTGTYSGIFRGFYYNPTLTSLTGTTHRGMEIASGDFIWGGGYSQYYGDSIEGFVQFQSSGNTTKIWIRPSGNQGGFNFNYWGYLENSGYTTTLKAGQYHDLSLAAETIRFKNQYLSEVARFVGSSGNLLLGTTTDSGYKLDVVGTVRVGSLGLYGNNGTTTAPLIRFNGSNKVNVDPQGYGTVTNDSLITGNYILASSGGIRANGGFGAKAGTSVVSTPFMSYGISRPDQDASINALAGMGGVHDGASGWYQGLGLVFYTSNGPDISGGSYLTEKMRLSSNGNFGIGTTAPTQLLHVAGNLRLTGAFYDSNNQAGAAGQILKSTGTGTDWVSLSEITGVDGTGTANYLAKWSDADTITNSLIYDNGTSVTINATSGGIYLNSNIGFGGPVNINDQFKFYYGQLQGNGNAYFTTYLNVGTSSNLGATLNVRGAGATSATKSLYIPNSDDSRTLSYTDDGKLTLSNGTYTTKWYVGSGYSPTLEFSAQGNITWGNGAIFRFYNTGDTTDYRLENGTFHTNHSQARFYAGSSGYLGFETIGSTTAYDAIGAVFTDNNTVSLRFFYKNTGSDIEGMRLTSSGNFLIGTTTDSGYRLDVNGTVRFGDLGNVYYATLTSGGADGGIFRVGGASYGYAQLQSYALTLNGGHGISGTGGTAQFSITSQVSPSAAQSNAAIRFVADNPGSGGGTWGAYSTALAFNFLKKETSGSYTSILAMNGGTNNVGIGTTTPGSKLTIDGVLANNIGITLQDSGTWRSSYFVGNGGTFINAWSNGLHLGVDGNNLMKFTWDSKIGVGQLSPTARFQIKGSGSTSATTSLLVENSAATASLTVLDNGTVSVGTSNTGVIMKNNGGYPSLAFWESIARWTIQREGSDVLNFVPNTTHIHGVISFVPGVYTGGVAIGNDTYQHASQLKPASAVLSLYAEAQGFLQPRLSTSQKNAIATPATGLQVYDSTLNKNNLYNGTSWLNIATETWVTSQNYVPQTRTLTINGTSYDLSANRSWTIATTTPGGSDTQFQYNSSGSLAGASALTYNSANNRIGVNQASPGYDFDVNGQVRVQDKLRVGTVNSGNGVVHMSSSATINPNTTTIVWAQNVSVGMCAFIEYYILNNNSLTDQRAGTIMVTWNQSGTPTIAHTETTTPDIGSTTSINFTSSLVGADARINAVNSSANPYTIVMSYKYF